MDAVELMNHTEEPLKLESQEWNRSSDESVSQGIEYIEHIIGELGLRRKKHA